MTARIKTRVLLLSDTHAALPQPDGTHDIAYRIPLPEADVAIHTGDLTMTGTIEEHNRAINLLKSIKAPLKIVIPGNHDLTLDRTYYANKRALSYPGMDLPDQQLDRIQTLYTGTDAQSSGIRYMVEGTQTFRLANGASLAVYASAFTPEFCDWAFPYPRSEDRFNSDAAANPIASFTSTNNSPDLENGRNIDILMTHGPPRTILDETSSSEPVGCDHLLSAVTRCRPLLHCFGHIHESWGARLKSWSLINHGPASNGMDKDRSTVSSVGGSSLMKQYNKAPHQWCLGPSSNEESLMIDPIATLGNMGVAIDATNLKRGSETLFVNASIMSLEYKPVQAPFIVDLLLDK